MLPNVMCSKNGVATILYWTTMFIKLFHNYKVIKYLYSTLEQEIQGRTMHYTIY